MQTLIADAKHKALRRKETVNLYNITAEMQRYYYDEGLDNWREHFVPSWSAVVDAGGQHWAGALGMRFDLRHLLAESWFNNYQLKFAQETTQTNLAGIHDLIQESLSQGWGADKLSRQMGLMFRQWADGNINPDKWLLERLPRYRTNMIARTESMRSLNAGTAALYSDWGVKQHEWLATLDAATRPAHAAANGQIVTVGTPFTVGGEQVMQPGDGSPENSINCFIPGTEVQGQIIAASKALYSGPVRVIETARGNRLTITPNHAVLTAKGWLPAHQLIEGMDLFSYAQDVGGMLLHDRNDQDGPTMIEDVFNALWSCGGSLARFASPLDFHSDGRYLDGKIDVVTVNRILPSKTQLVSRFQDEQQIKFKMSGSDLRYSRNRDSAPDQSLMTIFTSTPGLPSSGKMPTDNLWRFAHCGPLGALGIGSAAQWNTRLGQASKDRGSATMIFAGELVGASSGQIVSDEILRISDIEFSGHVYDLQAVDGWILAQNIVSSNCRCTTIPVVSTEDLPDQESAD